MRGIGAGPDYGEAAAAGDVHRFVEELFYEVASHSALPGLAHHQAGSRDFTEVCQECCFPPSSAHVIVSRGLDTSTLSQCAGGM